MKKYLSALFLGLLISNNAFAIAQVATTVTPAAAPPVKSTAMTTPAKNTAPLAASNHTIKTKPITSGTKSIKEKQLWNLQDVEILTVIAEVSRQTGKNFIVDPSITGKITIVSGKPLSSDEVYPVFLAALQVLGYSTVQQKDFIKIMPSRDANQTNPWVINQQDGPATGDELVVKVLRLKYVTASILPANLTPLIPNWANVTAYGPSNSIIVSGTANVVNRIARIIASIDTPASNGIDIVRLQYADAAETVKAMEKLQATNRYITGDLSANVSADTRTNSILISGNESTRLNYKVLIAQLDVSSQNNVTDKNDKTTDTKVFHLKYASVKSLMPVIRSMARQSVTSLNQQSPNTDSTNSSKNTMLTSAKINELSNDMLNAGATSATDQSGINIVGDVPNNALIVTAPPNFMRTVRATIEQLDVRPKQILIEGIIAEITADINNKFGIDWSLGPTNYFLGSNNMPMPLPDNLHGTFNPINLFGKGFITNNSIQVLLSALASDQNTNILSTPSIIVLNNTSAEFMVGQNLYVTGNTTISSAGSPAIRGFEEKNVGLTLNVAPQIIADNSIAMRISQSNQVITSPGSTDPNGNPNPITSLQKLNTSVLIKNAEILVLGGLLDNKEIITIRKVPFLGSIPLLGKLFQSKNKQFTKRNLVIFLRPTILDDEHNKAGELSKIKYDAMRSAQLFNIASKKSAKSNPIILPALKQPVLPMPFSK